MKLVVGLGNPGPKYELTKHNVGFLAVDRLIDRWKAVGPKTEAQAEIYTAAFGGERVVLVKPQTFMNLSGKSVGPLFGFYKVAPTDMVVIHDELDIDSMNIRIKTGGGPGGHNGLKSIDEYVGAANTGYHRVRIGIGRKAPPGERRQVVDHVLSPYSDKELEELDPILDDVADAIELTLKGDVKTAMNRYNKKNARSDGEE